MNTDLGMLAATGKKDIFNKTYMNDRRPLVSTLNKPTERSLIYLSLGNSK